MATIKVRDGESIEKALKRFKRAVDKSGILDEVKKRRFYEPPAQKRKKKSKAARLRAIRDEKKRLRRK